MTVRVIAHVADAAAGLVVVGTLAKWLPPIAAGLTIIWMAIRIGEWVWRAIERARR